MSDKPPRSAATRPSLSGARRLRERLLWHTVGRLGLIGRLDRLSGQLGFHRVEGEPLRRGIWVGERGGQRLRLRAAQGPSSQFAFRMDLRAPSNNLPTFGIQRASGAWHIQGDRTAAACVGTRFRSELLAGETLGVSTEGARFSSHRIDAIPRTGQIADGLCALVDKIRTLDRAPALLAQLLNEPEASLRREACEALLEAFPGTEVARQARAAALNDPAWSVRLSGTRGLPETEYVDALCAIASTLNAPVGVRTRAVEALAKGEPSDMKTHAILGFLADPEPGLRAAAVRALSHTQPAELLVRTALTKDRHPLVRTAAAQGWGQMGGPKAESLLVRLLGTDSDRRNGPEELELQRFVIEILGEMGSIACISTLSRFSEGAGLQAPLREYAQQAIYRIRSRLPPGTLGSLAVVNDPSGSLSDP